MYWANFIHIYQPPTQSPDVLARIAHECYRPLVALLRRYPQARLTVNISGSLTELLAGHGYSDVLEGLRALGEAGQVEFTASAMYHPLLPLIPRHQIVRQIQLNTEINRHYLGEGYRPRGFFPPEMAYNFEVADVAAELGYQWLLLDEIACPPATGGSRTGVYRHQDKPSLRLLFRERGLSDGISFGSCPTADAFLAALGDASRAEGYVLTATDGEVYGHHRPGQERLLEEIYSTQALPTCTLSQVLDLFPESGAVGLRECSWASAEDELREGIPYALWSYPGHELHDLQWRLAQLGLLAVSTACPDIRRYPKAQKLLDQGLHSCQFWWASCRPWWEPDMVLRGAKLIVEAIQALGDSVSEETTILAESLYEEIEFLCQEWQAEGRPARLARDYRERHSRVVPGSLTFATGDQERPD